MKKPKITKPDVEQLSTPQQSVSESSQILKELQKNASEPVGRVNLLKKKFGTWPHLRDWWRRKYHQDEILLVNMELRNGYHESLMVKARSVSFKYSDGLYVIDNELKYFHISTGLYALDYHQDCALPIKRAVPINEIMKTLESSQVSEVEYAVNPSTLERFLVAKIAEGIMKGQQIDEYLRQMKLILVITMVSSVLMLLLFVIKTGMLKGLTGQIPGLG